MYSTQNLLGGRSSSSFKPGNVVFAYLTPPTSLPPLFANRHSCDDLLDAIVSFALDTWVKIDVQSTEEEKNGSKKTRNM
ncbi:hypothetical protein E2C01_010143 [Portunus trituberculatus]|uniref:Uncharacterized protein n=1 Tax=Portunus trituberculatus TaxID=210409 RepID=A0A5B7D7R3_PORTR|nr:hypothetical protein [Portunus trituberculatus]